MSTILINYADGLYKKTQAFNSWTGRVIAGFDKVIEFGPKDIDNDFYQENKELLKEKRGAGLWLWKPYVVLKALELAEEGDYIFYCDSGSFFCGKIKKIIQNMKEDVWVSDIPLIEKQWTKPRVFETLQAASDEIKESNQIQGGFICVRKTTQSVELVREWLNCCCQPKLLLPEESKKGEFIEHREDQSLLSVLCKKRNIKPHKDPSQYGRIPEKYHLSGALFKVPVHPDDSYCPIIVLHRTKDVKLMTALRQWLLTWLPKPIIYRLINK